MVEPYKSQAMKIELIKLRHALNEKQHETNYYLGSNSWKVTAPLRIFMAWIRNPLAQFKRSLIGLIMWVVRPLSISKKELLRKLALKVSPSIFNHLNFRPPVDFVGLTSENPVVSVIIPVFGKIEFTLNCLSSIVKYPPKVAFEIIVVDDCSLDDSVKVLGKIKGIYTHTNLNNKGFIKSCNAGALISRGKYICFLNNDTNVTDGWLDNLYQTFKDLPGTGFVGSKLIYPNGLLQEAGGIIWRDGSAWNFGRNQNPDLPIFNYAREVDYCSGASIMVPRKVFDDNGGFDELYSPAYCEDADLALKIRRDGLRVIYQPTSEVIHFEGISSGTDTTKGVKAYQVENTKKLFQRWEEHLLRHQQSGKDIDNAKDRSFSKRVLVIDITTPTPNEDAGSVTTFNIMILLREMGFQVSFIPEHNLLKQSPFTEALQAIGIEVLYTPFIESVEDHVQEFGRRYDLVFLFRPTVVDLHIKTIRTYCSNAKVLFHTIDLHFLRMSREAGLQNNLVMKKVADEMKSLELSAIENVDATILHSTDELKILKPILPDVSLYVFPLILNVRGSKNIFKDRKDIVFIGGFRHAPNIDAVLFFVKEVFPLLQKRMPELRFYIVGSHTPPKIKDLATEYIKVLGFVEDLDSILDSVRLSIAPLRYGAGIKGKIGTSMSSGLPVVATSIAAEGMLLTNGENITLADSPEDFANKVSEVYTDESLWNHLSLNGVEFSEKMWGKESSMSTLSNILNDLNINQIHRGYPFNLYQ